MTWIVETVEVSVSTQGIRCLADSEFTAVVRDQLADGIRGSSGMLLGVHVRWSLSENDRVSSEEPVKPGRVTMFASEHHGGRADKRNL